MGARRATPAPGGPPGGRSPGSPATAPPPPSLPVRTSGWADPGARRRRHAHAGRYRRRPRLAARGAEPMRSGSTAGAEQAAAVLERLLIDPTFRGRFRADPAGTLERHGMVEVAARLRHDARMHTLELRESRSSLAGVLMAAAVE